MGKRQESREQIQAKIVEFTPSQLTASGSPTPAVTIAEVPQALGALQEPIALAFDFLNGVHDTANSIATIVSTRMLRPRYAVIWAAFFNFVAFLLFGVHVARTIGVGIVSADVMDARVIFGALMGAISWNLITWWAGIPSSSSHNLKRPCCA